MKSKPSAPRPLLALAALAAAVALQAADTLTSLWGLAPGDRTYLTTGNLERGVSYNRATGNALLVSRAGAPAVYVLRGSDGDDGSLQTGLPTVLRNTAPDEFGFETNVVEGGTFTLNGVAAADDGAVYAGNLSTSTTAPNFRLYRWADDAPDTIPTIAFAGDPGITNIVDNGDGTVTPQSNIQRWGDTLAARGAGTNTQVLLPSRNGDVVALLTTADGTNFVSTLLKLASGDVFQAGDAGLGIAFGEGNTFWAKSAGRALRHCQFDPVAGTFQTVRSFGAGQFPISGIGVGVDTVNDRLGVVDFAAHTLSVFDISDPANPVPVGDPIAFPGTPTGNGNGTGGVAFGEDIVVALDTNNGLMAYRIEKGQVVDPPEIVTEPANLAVFEGQNATFGVSVQGTPPFTYQWFFGEDEIPGAINSQLVISNAVPANEGGYSVVISNPSGTATSRTATLTVRSSVGTPVLTSAWRILPGERDSVNTDSTQRGLAFNPASGNVLYVSRTGSPRVVVLDGATGAEKHLLKTTDFDGFQIISGGTLPLNMIGVSADGAVYAANLVLDGAAGLRLYRWDDDGPETSPIVIDVFDLPAGQRFGDTLAVRGSGDDTQILLGSRSGTVAALVRVSTAGFATTQVFDVTGAAAGDFGLGVAFGAGDTFWGTAGARPVLHVAFNTTLGTAEVFKSYGAAQIPTAIATVGVDPARNLVAGLALETPDNIQLYNLTDPDAPQLLDQELLPVDNANVNGTGAVAFGGNRLFVLDSNNGIHAYVVDLDATQPAGPAELGAPAIADGNLTLTLTGTAGATYEVQTATALGGGFTAVGEFTVGQDGTVQVTVPSSGDTLFVRAVSR